MPKEKREKIRNYRTFRPMTRLIFHPIILCCLAMCCTLTYCKAQSPGKPSAKKLRILLISDLNDSYGSVTYSTEVHAMMRDMAMLQPDMILCGGDMVAGQRSSLTRENIDAMWRGFDTAVWQPIRALLRPFGFTLGNHDASPGFARDRAAASDFWQAHKAQTQLQFVDDTHYPFYFSYVQQDVFFISWDASSAVIPDSLQQWMRLQLALPVAIKAQARVVLGHLPLYALVAAKNKRGEVLNAADSTLAFFKMNKVDLYISGHQHAYFPGTKEKLALLHSGCLGGGPRPLLGDSVTGRKSYAIIEIQKRRRRVQFTVQGYLIDGHSPIALESLPKKITGFNGSVERWKKSRYKVSKKY